MGSSFEGRGAYLIFLLLVGLQKNRHHCGVGNRAQGMGYSLPLLSVFSDELDGRGLGRKRANLVSLVPAGLLKIRQNCGAENGAEGMVCSLLLLGS